MCNYRFVQTINGLDTQVKSRPNDRNMSKQPYFPTRGALVTRSPDIKCLVKTGPCLPNGVWIFSRFGHEKGVVLHSLGQGKSDLIFWS